MNFLERINAVLHHQKPDKIPFAPSENFIPRGDFEREMRNRGMGLYAKRAIYWSETSNVSVRTKRRKDMSMTIYRMPVGSISTGREKNKLRYMIEDEDDYEPVLFIINDTQFHADYSVYANSVRDLGVDGIVKGLGFKSPFEESLNYIGTDNLEKEQRIHPEKFAKLLEALEHRTERLLPIIEDSPAELISVGEINDSLTPEHFQEYILPFYQKYIPRLHESGKICVIEVRTSELNKFEYLISQTGIDVVEGFRPPPVGDLSLEEALTAWGNSTVLWLNFPETVLLEGAEKTREYTVDLLEDNAIDNNLVIGLTDMKSLADSEKEHNFKMGVKAVMEMVEFVSI